MSTVAADTGDRLAGLLAAAGVPVVFGVPGGQTLPFYAGLRRHGVRHVVVRDERNAGSAADAHARLTGRLGVCDATVGPGVTNLVSPLAEAFASSVPVLAVVADIPRRDEALRRRSVSAQALDQRALLSPVTKWVARVEEPAALDGVVAQAVRVAVSGRPGPVVLEVPEDVFVARADPPPAESVRPVLSPADASVPRHRSEPDAAQLRRAAAMLSAASRPLLLVGGGALLSGAGGELAGLAEAFRLPVVTTLSGKGAVDERAGYALGVCGGFGSPLAATAVRRCDVLLAVGTSLDQLTTFRWRLPGAGQRLIHADVDPEELGRALPVALPLVGDAQLTLRALHRLLGDRPPAGAGWAAGLRWAPPAAPAVRPPGEVPAAAVAAAVDDRLRAGDVVVCDASLASGWVAAGVRVRLPGGRVLAPRGLGGLGWSAGAALGARLAAAEPARVIVVAGDGGFGYGLMEVETAVRLGLRVVYLVLNNSALAWVAQAEAGGRPDSSLFSTVDFAAVARGLGASGVVVRDTGALAAELDRALTAGGPVVLDVRTSAEESPTVSLRSLP